MSYGLIAVNSGTTQFSVSVINISSDKRKKRETYTVFQTPVITAKGDVLMHIHETDYRGGTVDNLLCINIFKIMYNN